MEHSQTPTFHKMKVIGPRSAVMDVEGPIINPTSKPLLHTMLNPTVREIEKTDKVMVAALARGIAKGGVKRKSLKTVQHVAKKVKNQQHPMQSTELAIYNVGLQRLRALKSQLEQSIDPLVRLLAYHQQQAQTQAAPTHVQATADSGGVSTVGAGSMLTRVLDVLPIQYRKKYTALNQYLVENPDAIRISASGRPVIGGKELAGPNFVDTMRSLYVWRKPADIPESAHDTIRTLISIGVPGSVLSSSKALAAYDDIMEKQFMSQEVYESPSEGEETETGSTGSVIEQKQPQQQHQQQGKGVAHDAVPKWPGTLPKVLRMYKKY
jgi:hypothetical protein